MNPTTLAETILRDVERLTDVNTTPEMPVVWLDDVLAALSTALDGVDERAGEVLDSLAVLADMADLFSAPLLDDDDKPEMTVALERIVAAVPALLAQNAALRADKEALHLALGEASKTIVETKAERDALRAERDRYLRHLTAGAESLNAYKARAEAAEAQIAALTARVEGLTGAVKGLVEILDQHETKGPLPDVALMFCWLAAQEVRAVMRKDGGQ